MSTTHTLPGAMQDGRFVTNFEPVCRLNAEVAEQNKIPSWNSTEYRAYLQKNGLRLINEKFHATPCGETCSDHGLSIKPPAGPVTPPFTDEPELA